MIKNWKYILAFSASFVATTGFAQSVQDIQRLVEVERYKEAKASLRRLSTSNPNEEVSYYLGDLYLKEGKPDSANVIFSQALAKDDKSALSMIGLGKVALAKGNTAEAERQFDAAVKRTKGKDANIFKQIGRAYADTDVKDITKALGYIGEANKITKNNDAAAYITLGDIHQKNPNGGGEAMNAYDRAIQIDPNNATAFMKKGQLFVRSKNYNEAQAAFEKVIALNPNFAPAYRELGEMNYFVGKYDRAVENFKKYRSMAENSIDTQIKYASFLFLTEDYAGTLAEAQQVLQQDPNNLVMNRLMAYSLYKTNKVPEALQAMEKYFQLAQADPTKIIASDYAYYGRMLADTGKPAEATANLEKALAMDPQNLDVQNEAAGAYVKAKQYDKAIAMYKTKIAAKPSLVDNFKLADVYLAAEKFDTADSLYAGIIQARPEYATAYLRRAQVAEAKDKGQTGAAKTAYEEYIKVASQDPTKAASNKQGLFVANYYLGFQAYKAKDLATAKTYWTAAKSLDPTNKDVDVALKNIEAAQRRPAATTKRKSS
ncbi:tetratricopeptide repeat protein [Adhaeribacter pallidiroseus]|uniref:Protein-serine/threonine phosphatase n=1 Tax=Adhaeribacter pallidiroseus TaxID=2072847 RepID=A0A369QPG6_9BACT|nr:tetratricopeptide repeat protein [Adhaeribacter pallidiroseus]RDC66280.1 Protein-serine/threonine phosphatase [Adhaeribacter pallidiroseus]